MTANENSRYFSIVKCYQEKKEKLYPINKYLYKKNSVEKFNVFIIFNIFANCVRELNGEYLRKFHQFNQEILYQQNTHMSVDKYPGIRFFLFTAHYFLLCILWNCRTESF